MLLEQDEKICAICGKPIKQRIRFVLVLEKRERYRTYFKPTPLGLYFHEGCVKKISVNVKNLWDLIRVMNQLTGRTR